MLPFFFPIQYNWPIFPVSASIMVAAGNVYTLLRVHDGMPERKPPESIENQLI
jgi:hypothetical protein